MSPLTLLTGNPIQSILGIFGGGSPKSSTPATGSGQLSPFAQLMSTLQQVEQSSPSQYQQVTQQIATNLQSAAQTAQTQGNTTAANTLNQLATDFGQASTSGQLPNGQDLAAVLGHHHGHHHAHHTALTTSTADSSSASQNLSGRIAALQANSGQGDPLNPATIISNTLSGAGITI